MWYFLINLCYNKQVKTGDFMKKFLNSKMSNWFFSILIFILLILIIKFFILEFDVVRVTNMNPTLDSGDIVMINKLNKLTGYIKKTDIVQYSNKNKTRKYISRVIAMPKDSVEIVNDDIFVNGKKIYEPYVLSQRSKTLNNDKWILNDDEYFVINDDRELEKYNDSRYVGPIKKNAINGVVFFRLFPIDKLGSI